MGLDLHVEEDEVRLSFSNLPLRDNNISGSLQFSYSPTTSTDDQYFEFVTSQTQLPVYSNLVFCGKKEEEEEEEELNEYRKRDYLANLRSHSFRGASARTTAPKDNGDLSGSTRLSTGPSYHVNISALTTMSAKSRRIMFMFGPVKFKPEMELSEIKLRLRRPEPTEAPGKGGGSSVRSLWGVVRSNLRFRWRLMRVLARSLSCLPVGGGERSICVGN